MIVACTGPGRDENTYVLLHFKYRIRVGLEFGQTPRESDKKHVQT